MNNFNQPKPLDSRHIFLDTQVYRKLGHNVANPALRSLAKHIEARTVVLHITDLTLREVKRQIHDDVEARTREIATIEKTLRRWRHSIPELAAAPHIDGAAIAAALYRTFEGTIVDKWSAVFHCALEVSPKVVFDDYFARRAPFDQNGIKEFPDSFIFKAL